MNLRQNIDVENIQMELGKTYEITYQIPDADIADQKKLQADLSKIQTNIINSGDFKYIRSRLWGNTFTITVGLKKQKEGIAGLGILPLVALGLYVLGATVITALVGVGLKWTVTSIKEVSAPVIAVTQSILPIAIVIGIVYTIPFIAPLLNSLTGRKR